jgi:dipeptidyl aminopeptidase/acylaminoacyl peptidase
MKKTALIAPALSVFLGLGTLASNTTEHVAQAITPEDILSVRDLDELRLSPDGKKIAFVVREPGDAKLPRQPRLSNIWIMPTDGSARPHPIVPNLKNAYSPFWSPDGRKLAFLSDRRVDVDDSAGQTDQVYLLTLDGVKVDRLTSVPEGVEQFAWSPDGRTIAFVARDSATPEERQREAAGYDAIEVDHNLKPNNLWVTSLSDRKAVQVTKQDFEITELAWSPKGDELALVVARTPKPEDSFLLSLVVVNRTSGNVARTLSTNVAPISGLLKWSPNGDSITFLEGPATKDFASWLAVVPASGGSVRAIMKNYSGTIHSADWTPDSKHLLAQSIEGTREALLRIDSATGAVHKLADVNQSQWDLSFSTNGQTIAYLAQTPEAPSDIWVLTKDEQPRQITNFNPKTKSWRVGKIREVEWKNSQDGLTRRGVLITPPGYLPGNLYPTIVNTHPGDTAWWVGFHAKWWAWGQLLASNGYVVFLPNTRGVTGEGWRLHATTVDWGGMAFSDLMDGVDYLVAQRIADPNRLGIGGWSNGGFMTEYAITHTTRFKAAVAQAGHSDFFSLYGTSDIRGSLRISTLESPHLNRKWYDDHSPITLVRNCRTPTLLIHGINDRGVPVGQAYEFYTGLKDVGVETEMVVYPREGHSIREHAHQLDVQKRVLAWFDKHLRS